MSTTNGRYKSVDIRPKSYNLLRSLQNNKVTWIFHENNGINITI